ncbi:uncharacterized protein LOC129322871 isoform X2 [Prosopis cineraria]|uniref:uncharacterized protein LOC129322871 isoform X2 n=1 Tax=Prosopis cineraria TaxID=364024 RepID=UPI00240FC5A6|nr:uncharacterized protein LOC129322871 isoform X2 [Prosopis cineraria]
MGSCKGKIKREHSHLTENWEFPQYDTRLMRRLKRRSIASETMVHNYIANATKKNVVSCGYEAVKNTENSGHVVEEEVDEDYGFFLDELVFHVDVVGDNNVIASDIDVNTSHDSNNDDDIDSQYKMFLENLRDDDSSYILKVFSDNQFFFVKYEGQEERLHDWVASEIQCEGDDEDYQIFLNSLRMEGDNLVFMPESALTIKYEGSESEEKSSNVRQNLQVLFEATELASSRQGSDDYLVAKDKYHGEVFRDVVDGDWQVFLNCVVRHNSEEKGSSVKKNLQAPFAATEHPNSRPGSDDCQVAWDKCNSEVLRGVVDEDWQVFLNSVVRKNFEEKSSAVRKNLQVSNEATEPHKARNVSDAYHVTKHSNEVQCGIDDEDYQLFLNSSRIDDDHLICMPERAIVVKYGGSESEERSSKVKQNLQVPYEVTELPNARQCSDDFCVAKNKHHGELLSDNIVDRDWQVFLNSFLRQNTEEKCSSVRQNLLVSNEATEPPGARQGLDACHVVTHKCNGKGLCNIVDENYQLFLKSVSIAGDNLIYMPENDVTAVYDEECDQSSTDSEPVVLDPRQHYEDSPLICSKSCHSSFLANEGNHEDNIFMSCAFDSYRKGLMEELKRPFNQNELDKHLQVASHVRPKEQHRDLRNGVMKDRPAGGDNNKTSYLKIYSGLRNAINQVKEPHKVLFLLRGFFYWLKGGAFQPWLDASCLEMLQNL